MGPPLPPSVAAAAVGRASVRPGAVARRGAPVPPLGYDAGKYFTILPPVW
jgi:hypothetical protein